MKALFGWVGVGAAAPAAMVLVWVVVEAITTEGQGSEDLVGWVILILGFSVVAGIVCGAVLGAVDAVLRRVVRGAPDHRRRIYTVVSCLVLFVLSAMCLLPLAALMSTSMPLGLLVVGVIAAIPAAVSYRRYLRLPPSRRTVPAGGGAAPSS